MKHISIGSTKRLPYKIQQYIYTYQKADTKWVLQYARSAGIRITAWVITHSFLVSKNCNSLNKILMPLSNKRQLCFQNNYDYFILFLHFYNTNLNKVSNICITFDIRLKRFPKIIWRGNAFWVLNNRNIISDKFNLLR